MSFLTRTCAIALMASLGSVFAADTLTIAVVPKGTTHDFWKSVHAGAKAAEKEFVAAGVKVKTIWKGPLKEDDRTSQIDVVQGFTTKGVSGIVLAPLDAQALVAPVEMAVGQGIPVVIIDSALKSDKITSFVATDNKAGGKAGGKLLAERTNGQAKAILLRYLVGSASTMEREAGFLEAVAAVPGITVLSSDQHAGATRESALNAAQNLVGKWGNGMTAVFTPNEPSTVGMALALKEAGLAGKVIHVGFDASEPLIAALKEDRIAGLVVQDPWRMGYLGVKQCVNALRGEKVDKQVDTPVRLITKADLDKPEVQELLHPRVD